MSWPCYVAQDVVAAYVGSAGKFNFTIKFDKLSAKIWKHFPDGKTFQAENLENLDGAVLGRIMIDGGRKVIEASLFSNGQAQGRGKMTFRANTGNPNDDFFLVGTFQNGCLESTVLGYSFLPLFDEKDVPIHSNDTVLTYISNYVRGIPVGPVWRQSKWNNEVLIAKCSPRFFYL